MEAGAPLLWPAYLAGVGAVGVLRLGWGLPHRSTAWNGAGWGLLLAALLWSGYQAGAWGVSVTTLVTTGAAFVALAVAGLRSPRGRGTAANRRAGMLPQSGEPWQIGRRVATFLLVIPGGCAASVLFGMGMRGLGMLLGWGEANANVAAFYAVPVGWALLATLMLMQARRRDQIATLAVSALAGVPFLVIGA